MSGSPTDLKKPTVSPIGSRITSPPIASPLPSEPVDFLNFLAGLPTTYTPSYSAISSSGTPSSIASDYASEPFDTLRGLFEEEEAPPIDLTTQRRKPPSPEIATMTANAPSWYPKPATIEPLIILMEKHFLRVIEGSLDISGYSSLIDCAFEKALIASPEAIKHFLFSKNTLGYTVFSYAILYERSGDVLSFIHFFEQAMVRGFSFSTPEIGDLLKHDGHIFIDRALQTLLPIALANYFSFIERHFGLESFDILKALTCLDSHKSSSLHKAFSDKCSQESRTLYLNFFKRCVTRNLPFYQGHQDNFFLWFNQIATGDQPINPISASIRAGIQSFNDFLDLLTFCFDFKLITPEHLKESLLSDCGLGMAPRQIACWLKNTATFNQYFFLVDFLLMNEILKRDELSKLLTTPHLGRSLQDDIIYFNQQDMNCANACLKRYQRYLTSEISQVATASAMPHAFASSKPALCFGAPPRGIPRNGYVLGPVSPPPKSYFFPPHP